MRIALLSPYTDPVKGGISSYTRELIDTYRDMGMVADGLAVEGRTNQRFLVLGPSKTGFSIRAFLRLAYTKPDVVHAHSHWYVLVPGVLLRKVRPGTRLLFTFHTMPTDGDAGLGYRMLRCMLRFCDGVTFVSRHLMEAVQLPRSIRQAVVHPAPEREAKRFPADSRTPRRPSILFIGPLVWPGKAAGVLRLVEAFARVARSYPEWRLIVIGEGPFRSYLEHQAKRLGLDDKASFMGRVDNVFDEIASAEVYAHVSLQEGLPLSLLNAMAMGKPVLATAVGGMPEVVADHITGRLVPPSVEAIASVLLELIGDEAQRKRLGDAAREWVSKELAWEKVATRHMELVSAL